MFLHLITRDEIGIQGLPGTSAALSVSQPIPVTFLVLEAPQYGTLELYRNPKQMTEC